MSNSAPHHAAAAKKDGIPLGRIAGIPVYLAYSWFVIAAFTVIVYGPALLARTPHLGIGAYFVAFGYAVLLAISVLVHELAHALSAKSFNWPTEKIVLNLWGGHTQFESFTASPGRSVIVALAGPASNFVLAGVVWLVLSLGWPAQRRSGNLDEHLHVGQSSDRRLQRPAGFAPGRRPLGGISVWKATGSQDKGTVAAGWAGRIIVVALAVWFVGLPLLSGSPLDLNLVLITVLVCGFLWMGASGSIQAAKLRSRLFLVSAAGLAEPAVGIPGSASVADVLAISPAGHPVVVMCAPDGKPQGVVDPEAIAAVPPYAASTTPVAAVAHALAAGAYVPEWSKGQELIQYLARLEGAEYAVVDQNGLVTGLLRQQTVVTAITGKEARGSGRA